MSEKYIFEPISEKVSQSDIKGIIYRFLGEDKVKDTYDLIRMLKYIDNVFGKDYLIMNDTEEEIFTLRNKIYSDIEKLKQLKKNLR